MLPEFLLTVGQSMQEITRDDYNLLNGAAANAGSNATTNPNNNNSSSNNNNDTQHNCDSNHIVHYHSSNSSSAGSHNNPHIANDNNNNNIEDKEEMCITLALPCNVAANCHSTSALKSTPTTADTATTTTTTLPAIGIKLEDDDVVQQQQQQQQLVVGEHEVSVDAINDIDLFPAHAGTWQQHPMNSQEHAHHRLQHQQQQHQHHQHHHQHQHHQHQHHPHSCHQQLPQQDHEHDNHQLHINHHYDAIDVGVGVVGLGVGVGVGSTNTTAHNSSKLLLQSSDDPLICRGANDDDNPLELKTLMAAVTVDRQQQQQQQHALMTAKRPTPTISCCSSLTKQQLKMKAGLMSAAQQQQQQQTTKTTNGIGSGGGGGVNTIVTATVTATTNHRRPAKPKAKKNGVMKLRFHHQALPPEYLSHYEATQGQYAARAAQQQQQQPPHAMKLHETVAQQEQQQLPQQHAPYKVQPPKVAQTAKLPPPKSSHENVRSWLQKIAEIQRTAEQQQQQQQQQHQKQRPSNAPRAAHHGLTTTMHATTATTTGAAQRHDMNNNRLSMTTATAAVAAAATSIPPTLVHKPMVNVEDMSCRNGSHMKLKLNTVTQQQKQHEHTMANVQHSPPPLLPAPITTTMATILPAHATTTTAIAVAAATTTAPSTTSSSTMANSTSTKRVVQYTDLPYMGEITLHSKPRRGRKPKKADICHLIYKNYGTIFPGTPQHAATALNGNSHTSTTTSHAARTATTPHVRRRHQRRRVQPRSRSLEALRATKVAAKDEPLNLCLRDQCADLCSISSSCDDEDVDDDDDDEDDRVQGNEAGSTSGSGSSASTPVPTTLTDRLTDTLLAANLRNSMPRLNMPAGAVISATPNDATINAQVHPVSVYYQKLIESSTLLQPNGSRILGPLVPVETIEKDNQIALKIPIPSGLLLMPKSEKCSPVPTTLTTTNTSSSAPPGGLIDYPEPLSTPSSIKSENSTLSANVSHVSHQQQQQELSVTPQKRKRSAIFIPPVPTESSTSNPATEVSICKFKFTGGPKPTLQEKKMLSVDSDGNYRYYSGTGGDKNMRCEFFPRESLQQSAGVLPGVNSRSGFFSNAEKISIDIPPPSAGLSNELLQLPESPTSTLLLPPPPVASPTSPQPFNGAVALREPATTAFRLAAPAHTEREHKKKSRRSSQREKLEKTFKENGFLIQTQQLESAEGATYCKFRQLKKFTRYLFRNWKDYLPDELQAKAAAAAAAAISNGDTAAPEDAVALENLLASHGFRHHLRSDITRQQQESQHHHLQLDESAVREV